jgi:hypothetical protein
MVRGFKTSLLLLALVFCCELHGQDRKCQGFLATAATEKDFLLREQGHRASSCITDVIRSLATKKDIESPPILARYLDYADPRTVSPSKHGADQRPRYPAVDALYHLGSIAVPDLLRVIEQSQSLVIRQNATLAYLAIYADQDDIGEGLHKLHQREEASADPQARMQLHAAMELLLRTCESADHSKEQRCRANAK